MTRMGKKSHPFYRVGVFDQRTARDGKAVEVLGYYDPFAKETATGFKIKVERLQHWLSVGAQPTEKMVAMLKRAGAPYRRASAPSKGAEAAGAKA